MIKAAQFVQVLQHQQGIMIAYLEEVAMRRGLVVAEGALALGDEMGKLGYAGYLPSVAIDFRASEQRVFVGGAAS